MQSVHLLFSFSSLTDLFYLSTQLVSIVFKHIDQIQKTFLQKLIWHQICSAMASLFPTCTFKIVNVSQQRYPYICFHKVTIITIYIQFSTVTFRSFNFQWLPNFFAFISCLSDNAAFWITFRHTWTFPFSLYVVMVVFNCSAHHFFLCFNYVLCVITRKNLMIRNSRS